MKKKRIIKIKEFLIYEVVKKGLFRYLSDYHFARIDYLSMIYKFPDLKHPKTFSEKIQWAKVYGGLERYWRFVDKYEVRKFVAAEVGKQYLTKIHGIWESFEEIDFQKLPSRFVLKGTHGSGYVYICQDKSKLDLADVRKETNRWLKENFYIRTREKQYNNCKPRIISEEFLEDENGELIDYKFFCFNGKPHLVEVIWDRFTDHKGDIYMDFNWKNLNISYIGTPVPDREIPKPQNLDEMIEIARKLSKGFPFVRVDLYSIHTKIYFGELTFLPASGLERFDPPEIDKEWGSMIDLELYKVEPPNNF